jgi:hypothetical protein
MFLSWEGVRELPKVWALDNSFRYIQTKYENSPSSHLHACTDFILLRLRAQFTQGGNQPPKTRQAMEEDVEARCGEE